MTILEDVKDTLLLSDTEGFDPQILAAISLPLLDLVQVGVAKDVPELTPTTTWADFAGDNDSPSIRSYVYHKVGLDFDPPANSFVLASKEKYVAELLWRINSQLSGAHDAI